MPSWSNFERKGRRRGYIGLSGATSVSSGGSISGSVRPAEPIVTIPKPTLNCDTATGGTGGRPTDAMVAAPVGCSRSSIWACGPRTCAPGYVLVNDPNLAKCSAADGNICIPSGVCPSGSVWNAPHTSCVPANSPDADPCSLPPPAVVDGAIRVPSGAARPNYECVCGKPVANAALPSPRCPSGQIWRGSYSCPDGKPDCRLIPNCENLKTRTMEEWYKSGGALSVRDHRGDPTTDPEADPDAGGFMTCSLDQFHPNDRAAWEGRKSVWSFVTKVPTKKWWQKIPVVMLVNAIANTDKWTVKDGQLPFLKFEFNGKTIGAFYKESTGELKMARWEATNLGGEEFAKAFDAIKGLGCSAFAKQTVNTAASTPFGAAASAAQSLLCPSTGGGGAGGGGTAASSNMTTYLLIGAAAVGGLLLLANRKKG